MNVLFLSAWYPVPADNGSKLRILNLIRSLSQRHNVTLITAVPPEWCDGPGSPAPPELSGLCERVEGVPWQPHPAGGARRLISFLVPLPEWVLVQAFPAMGRAIAREVRSGRYDLIVASEVGTAVYARQFGGVPALLDDLELGAYCPSPGASSPGLRRLPLRREMYWWKLRRAMPRLLRHFGACTVVSSVERQLVEAVAPGYGPVAPQVIPNCVDVQGYRSVRVAPAPGTLVFSGSLTFPANYEAVSWFLREVYPLVCRQRPDVHLRITGKHGKLLLPIDRADPRIVLTGFVQDVRPLIAGSWASIVPLRTGGGTRLKIVEAMALGTPVVSTSKGIEGLDIVPGEHALVADEPSVFAEHVLRLLADPELRARLAANGRRLVQDKYDWGQVGARFVDLCERVARHPGPNATQDPKQSME